MQKASLLDWIGPVIWLCTKAVMIEKLFVPRYLFFVHRHKIEKLFRRLFVLVLHYPYITRAERV